MICWLREAISDENNLVDMAYVAIGMLCVGALTTLAFVCIMAVVSYSRCIQIDASHGVGAVITAPCVFDPLPIGQAAGLIFAAFAALIGALAGYMAATRRQAAAPKVTIGPAENVNVAPQPAPVPPVLPPQKPKKGKS